MGKITAITVLSVVTFAVTTFALEVGVGAFYAPARVVGEATEMDEYSGKEFSKGGFKGRVSFGVYEGLNVAIGFGYNNLIYREEPITYPEVKYVLSLPTYITTFGADYAFPLGPFSPFAGGGAAIARESAEARGHTAIDWYGGLYVEGGARYFLGGNLAVEAGPRYTFLFDEPVVYYKDYNVRGFVRSEHRSQLIELLFGINYYF
ncbi:MAG: outer membrane beta-barrel protein [bacterium]